MSDAFVASGIGQKLGTQIQKSSKCHFKLQKTAVNQRPIFLVLGRFCSDFGVEFSIRKRKASSARTAPPMGE